MLKSQLKFKFMISNFAISENENPNIAIFRKLKAKGILSSLEQNIQRDLKEQQYIPQNEFSRMNLTKILKKTQNFKKSFLEPNAFTPIEYVTESVFYKSIGKFRFSSDSKLVYKMKFEKEDRRLQQNQAKIIKKLIQKKNYMDRLPKMKAFNEKLILWLAKSKDTHKVEPGDAVTLLKSLESCSELREKKMAIDEQIYKTHENDYFNEEHHFSGIVYPKLENIIDFFEIPPPMQNVIIKKSYNLIARENDLFHRDLDDSMACSSWKLKDIKKFFILSLKHFKKFEIISQKLQKDEQECRTFFRLTGEYFGLKNGYKDIKRSKNKNLSKEIIQEVIFFIYSFSKFFFVLFFCPFFFFFFFLIIVVL